MIKFFKYVLFLFLLPLYTIAQSLPALPKDYVTDEANVLSVSEEKKLNDKLLRFERTTGNQLFVYVTSSLNGKNMERYCTEIFNHWEIGQKGKDNGILVAVFISDHKFRIQTGYGLEGALPDLLTKKIQEEEMVPSFKNNDYFEGIDNGVDKLIYFSKHEYTEDDLKKSAWDSMSRKDKFSFIGTGIAFLIINLLFVGSPFYHLVTSRGRMFSTKKRVVLGILFIILFFVPFIGGIIVIAYSSIVELLPAKAKTRGFSFGGGGSSSSSSSSSSSGFSGGGGGRSGGGGSSSSW